MCFSRTRLTKTRLVANQPVLNVFRHPVTLTYADDAVLVLDARLLKRAIQIFMAFTLMTFARRTRLYGCRNSGPLPEPEMWFTYVKSN